DIPHNQTIGDVFVDINASQGPNRMGKDVFNFVLMNDGSLEPMGTSRSWLRSGSFNPSYVPWRDHSEKCNKDNVTGGFFCAGSIFDNGMKIIYQ
ncbi:hypothetical protein IKQ21_08580, partial [bacterium]|nr:hypothetical protein [bacterium]